MTSNKLITTTFRPMRQWLLSPPLQIKESYWSLMKNGHLSMLGSSTTFGDVAKRWVSVEHHRRSQNDSERTDTENTETPFSSGPPARNRSRRSRSKRMSLEDKKVPSYKEFVHRFTVLSLYRGYLKCIRDSMPHNQDDLTEQVRREFRINMHDKDPFAVKRNLAEGQRQFEELREFTGQSNKYTGESWINIQDPDDPRGRVGTGWPWAK
mmetsp:Transcript_17404/g.40009  ORF Transcript_17404/g.40009 Transcript_17404/m.40009 type:complete len:209 (-) Transcript_17404:2030-2656(-)